jgi:hypothetical protein
MVSPHALIHAAQAGTTLCAVQLRHVTHCTSVPAIVRPDHHTQGMHVITPLLRKVCRREVCVPGLRSR